MKSFKALFWGGLCLLLIILFINFRADTKFFLSVGRLKLSGFFDSDFNYGNFQKLRLENASLKTMIEEAKKRGELANDQFDYLTAEVYSRYPFNDRSSLLVDIGSANGVKAGMPVLVSPGVILGRVRTVKRTQSEVQTIFDSDWKISVGIGSQKSEALFQGGLEPRLEFVSKETNLSTGDEVLNRAPELPLNFLVGRIGKVDSNLTQTWLGATLEPPYNLEQIKEVFIVTNFP